MRCSLLFFAIFLFVIKTLGFSVFSTKHAITYEGGARFGDRLIVYAQARYLSYLTSTPFVYKKFIYSDKIAIDYLAKSYDDCAQFFANEYHINSCESLSHFFSLIQDSEVAPTLFVLDYLPLDISEWFKGASSKLLFNIPWNDAAFISYLKRTLHPKIPIPNLCKQDVVNVAVHVRTLSGDDTAETSFKSFPLKHPTIEYHFRQLMKVHRWNQYKPLYAFIFTDSKNPKDILRSFCEKFQGSNIEFAIQEHENPDTMYAVQDFFAMQKFDVLIATQSNFSMMAGLIGNFDMVIFPVHETGVYPNYQIDWVQVNSFGASWFPYKVNAVFKER